MSGTPRALIVHESMFGNTRQVADAIADGLRTSIDVELVPADQAPAVPPDDVVLLVVGGPTHAFGMSRPATRVDASVRGELLMPLTTGIREWLEQLRCREAPLVSAAFDTRVSRVRRLPGSAARAAAKVLHRRGYDVVLPPASFYVQDVLGPIGEGELDRARAWGKEVGEQLEPALRVRSVPRAQPQRRTA
jgi:hypothetical protein